MSIRKEIKYFFLLRFLPLPACSFLKLYSKTMMLEVENSELVRDAIARGRRVVFASWHQRFFGGFYIPVIFGLSPSIMISRSRDGDFISAVVERIGWKPVRGSSSVGGREALAEMIAMMRSGKLGGHIVDGPTGLAQIIKAGLIALAQHAEADICPTYVSYENPWIMRSWDRFMIPKPFSRVLLRFGRLKSVPKEMDDRRFEELRRDLESEMVSGYAEADRHWDDQLF